MRMTYTHQNSSNAPREALATGERHRDLLVAGTRRSGGTAASTNCRPQSRTVDGRDRAQHRLDGRPVDTPAPTRSRHDLGREVPMARWQDQDRNRPPVRRAAARGTTGRQDFVAVAHNVVPGNAGAVAAMLTTPERTAHQRRSPRSWCPKCPGLGKAGLPKDGRTVANASHPHRHQAARPVTRRCGKPITNARRWPLRRLGRITADALPVSRVSSGLQRALACTEPMLGGECLIRFGAIATPGGMAWPVPLQLRRLLPKAPSI